MAAPPPLISCDQYLIQDSAHGDVSFLREQPSRLCPTGVDRNQFLEWYFTELEVSSPQEVRSPAGVPYGPSTNTWRLTAGIACVNTNIRSDPRIRKARAFELIDGLLGECKPHSSTVKRPGGAFRCIAVALSLHLDRIVTPRRAVACFHRFQHQGYTLTDYGKELLDRHCKSWPPHPEFEDALSLISTVPYVVDVDDGRRRDDAANSADVDDDGDARDVANADVDDDENGDAADADIDDDDGYAVIADVVDDDGDDGMTLHYSSTAAASMTSWHAMEEEEPHQLSLQISTDPFSLDRFSLGELDAVCVAHQISEVFYKTRFAIFTGEYHLASPGVITPPRADAAPPPPMFLLSRDAYHDMMSSVGQY